MLGLLLFQILINLCGDQGYSEIGKEITYPKKKFTPSSFHAMFVDDMTVAEALTISESVLPNPDRSLPDTYHARFGLKLDPEKSKVYDLIQEITEYSTVNEMKLNLKKTKFMLFNPTNNYDFVPDLTLEGVNLETFDEMRLLGLIVRSDLSWKSNTEQMISRAYKKLWILKRLKGQGASLEDFTDIYVKQVRSILEFGVPVWNSKLIQEEINDIERVQKSFMYIALGDDFTDYKSALYVTDLETLSRRRTKLCLNFATKCLKHPKHNKWFVKTEPGPNTRSVKPSFKVPFCRLTRTNKGPIPYLTRLLNNA